MNPVYSRDECVMAFRDFYNFLGNMFIDPEYIQDAPPGGWPSVTLENAKELKKSEEVISLLRHLPYITHETKRVLLEETPGGHFLDWQHIIAQIGAGKEHAENMLDVSEGIKDQFGGKIPSYCIGLVFGGTLLSQDTDIIILDTKCGLISWMDCPAQILESASPQSSHLVYPLEGESEGGIENQDNGSIGEDGKKDRNEDEEEGDEEKGDEEEEDEEEEDEDEDDEGEEEDDEWEGTEDIHWGPCWPVRHFFEMLKNQYRQLNFMCVDRENVIDIWHKETPLGEPIPEDFIGTMQAIYHKHGWPDIRKYQKEKCLDELQRVLKDRYPEYRLYYDWH